MQWLIAGISGIAFVEMIARLPFVATIRELWKRISRVFSVISSRKISDHWKEKIVLIYAVELFKLSMTVTFLAFVSFLPAAAIIVGSEFLGVPVIEFSLSAGGIALVTAISSVYALIRYRRAASRI